MLACFPDVCDGIYIVAPISCTQNDGHESKSLVRVEGDACPDSNDGMAVMNDATCTTATAVENAPKVGRLRIRSRNVVSFMAELPCGFVRIVSYRVVALRVFVLRV